MKSLQNICGNCLVQLLIKTLECRKKKITKWIVSIDEWIAQLNIQDIKEFLESSLSTQILDTLFVRIMEIIVGTSVSDGGGARNHDILAAFMTILITNKTVKLILPSCLKTNERIRLHALSTVYKNLDRQNDEHDNSNSLQQVAFQCYNDGQLFYISDEERNLVTNIIGKSLASYSPKLKYLSLQGVATNDTVQELVTNNPGCPNLQYLCLSHNKEMDDLSVQILVGLKFIYKKGPLTKIISRNTGSKKEVESYICAFRKTLCLLDFSKCSVTMVGKEFLEKHFEKRCRIVLHG